MVAEKVKHKVYSKAQVEEIWHADERLTLFIKYWLKALYEEEDELAARLKDKCDKIKQEMLDKYDIIL